MTLPQDALGLVIGLGVLLGAVQCFFGFKIFKIILGITGFIVGGVVAGSIGYAISQQEVVALLAGIVGGAIGATIWVALYFVGIFFMGGILGGIVGTVLYGMANSTPEPAVLLILAVIAGVLAVIFQKFMIIASTGFSGAWNVVTGIAYFTTGSVDPTNIERLVRSGGTQLYAVFLCWLLLGIVGVVFQYRTAPQPQSQARPKR